MIGTNRTCEVLFVKKKEQKQTEIQFQSEKLSQKSHAFKSMILRNCNILLYNGDRIHTIWYKNSYTKDHISIKHSYTFHIIFNKSYMYVNRICNDVLYNRYTSICMRLIK